MINAKDFQNKTNLRFRKRALSKLSRPAAAVLVFFTAPARTRFVSSDFWERTPHWEIDRHLARAIAIHRDSCHRANRLELTRARRRVRRWRGRCIFAEQELRKAGEEILERLQI